MATIAAPGARPLVGKFYLTMAAVFIAIAFGGFFETYWLQIGQGTFTGPAMLHLHGLLFSAWTLFFYSQARLVAHRQLKSHRAWGMLGISLATAMLFTGLAVAIEGLHNRIGTGLEDAGRAFFIVPVSAVLMFVGFVAAALVNVRRSEWHKRFMLAGTVSVLQAPIARFFFLAATGGGPGLRPGLVPPPPPAVALMGAGVTDLLLLAAMVHDWRSHGRLHAAYRWAFALTVAIQLSRPLTAQTEVWYRVTDFLLRF